MTTDFRALCADLLRELDHASAWDYQQALKDQARAALADEPAVPEGREPASVTTQPSDAELDELAWTWYSKTGSTWYQIEAFRAYARAVLARWGNSQGILDCSPQPVAVSEGLPRPDDCDDEGYCWWWRTDAVGEWWEFLYLRDVRDHNRRCGLAQYTHWLPYRAIPNLPNPND